MSNLLKISCLVIIGVFVLVGILGAFVFVHNLQLQNTAVNNQWNKIETLYTQKIDLTSELINNLQGSINAEDAIVNEFNQAKNTFQSSKTSELKVKNIVNVEISIKKFIAMLDRYPELQSKPEVSQKVNELLALGDNISPEAIKYNDLVTKYNALFKSFPNNLFARLNGYSKRSQLLSI